MKTRDRFGTLMHALRWPYLTLIVFLMLVPVYLLVKVSISAPQDVYTAHPPYSIEHATLEHWVQVLQSGNIWPPLVKSLTVATATTVLAIIIAAPGAYVIARLPRAVKYVVVLALLFTRMFPDVGIALTIAIEFVRLNLIDSTVGLVLAHLIPNLPFLAWILVGTFDAIPRDLELSAMIDGASRLQALTRVVFPLSKMGIAVGALFVWLNSWNEFTFALYLSITQKTLPLITYYYLQRGDWFSSAAYATIIMIPVLIVTFFLQRYLRSGYLAGAIKQ